jgi:hypothetical protein
MALIMVGFLVFTGFAYLNWGADEAYNATREYMKKKAYYTAHAGIMDRGFQHLRSLNINNIPVDPMTLGYTYLSDQHGDLIARAETWMQPDINIMGTAFADYNYLDYWSIGRVESRRYSGEQYGVEDTVSLKVKLLGLSHYFYLTDNEKTPFNEVIKFWHEDTLEGWVHSNDTIAIMENPVFYDRVTTVAPVFWQGSGYNPQFVNYPPTFNYREVYLPETADEIREAALAYGNFFDSENGTYAHRLVFDGDHGWTMYRWYMGTPFDSSTSWNGSIPQWEAIFVDGYLELEGTVKGQVTVGARGHPNDQEFLGYHCIRLRNDIKYWFANSYNGSFNDTTGGYTDILGIVSESNITIANTEANGRENGGNYYPGDPNRNDIIITAAMVALGNETYANYWGSFSFEDQNEPPPTPTIWEFFTADYSAPQSLPSDERGDIFLWGAVTQRRRGYVHRSNHGGTGYGKEYHFDDRLRYMTPPYFIKATDSSGNAFFQVISWGDQRQIATPLPVSEE